MATRDLVVVGASLGGVDALRTLARRLPPDLPAAIAVVLHRMPDSPGFLEKILGEGGLKVKPVTKTARLERGNLYVAPPDAHVVIEGKRLRTVFGAKINGHRPAIDPLFLTAAEVYGPRVVGLVLTGSRSDGAAGLAAIKESGGVTMVQDPLEALSPEMPLSAMRRSPVDYCLPLERIPEQLQVLVNEQAPHRNKLEPKKPLDLPGLSKMSPATLICPSCGGALSEDREGGVPRLRCHTGHLFSLQGLDAEQSDSLENALWAAVRSLKERAVLQRRLAAETKTTSFSQKAARNERYASSIERMIKGVVG